MSITQITLTENHIQTLLTTSKHIAEFDKLSATKKNLVMELITFNFLEISDEGRNVIILAAGKEFLEELTWYANKIQHIFSKTP